MSMKTISTKEAMLAAERAIAAGDKGTVAKTLALFGAFFEMRNALKSIESEIKDQISQHKFDIKQGEDHPAFKVELEKWQKALDALAHGDKAMALFVAGREPLDEGTPQQDNTPVNDQ